MYVSAYVISMYICNYMFTPVQVLQFSNLSNSFYEFFIPTHTYIEMHNHKKRHAYIDTSHAELH